MLKISCCWLYAIDRYGYPPSLPDTFLALKDMSNLGFKYVELEGVKTKNMQEIYLNKEKIKEFCAEIGVEVVNFCPILPDLFSLDLVKKEQAWEDYLKGIEIAKYFDVKMIQVDSFAPPVKFKGEVPYSETIKYGQTFHVDIDPDFCWKSYWETLVETYLKCNQAAKESNLNLIVEPRIGEVISNTDAFLRLSDHVNDDNFGIVLDTGHQNAQKEMLPFSVEKLGSKIKYLHVSDNDGLLNEHNALGDGTIDWEGIFTALKKHGFTGYVAIDIGGVKEIDEKYVRSKDYLIRLFKKIGVEYDV